MTRMNSDNKGFILIASYMVIALLIILATSFATRSIGEQRVTDKERDSIQAFWLAEAGLDTAVLNLGSSSLSGSLGRGGYSAQITSVSATRFLVVSTGGVPGVNPADPNNTLRTITAIVEQPLSQADPSVITSVITANGDVIIHGSVEINGNIDDNAIFDFEEIFGISKQTMESNSVNVYTDPENNVSPVNATTWVNIETSEDFRITENGWTGNGILVVNGNAKITGGHFQGVLWVIGTLWISGNPVIDGAIYVESGAEFDTTLTGNPVVTYDADVISDAFGYLPSNLPPYIAGWKEN